MLAQKFGCDLPLLDWGMPKLSIWRHVSQMYLLIISLAPEGPSCTVVYSQEWQPNLSVYVSRRIKEATPDELMFILNQEHIVRYQLYASSNTCP